MDCKFSDLLDEDINTILECFLTLPEIPDPTYNPLIFAIYVNCSNKINNIWLYKENIQNNMCISP